MNKREIITFLNTQEVRKARCTVGGVLLLWGALRMIRGKGGLRRFLFGGLLVGTGWADKCPINVAFGLPFDGEEARAILANETKTR